MKCRNGVQVFPAAAGLLLIFLQLFTPFALADLDPSLDGTLNVEFKPMSSGLSPRHLMYKERLLAKAVRPPPDEFWGEGQARWELLWSLHGFYRYRERHLKDVFDWEGSYGELTEEHKHIVRKRTNYESNFDETRKRFEINSKLCEGIINYSLDYYGITMEELVTFVDESEAAGRMDNQRRTEDALYHLQRDWSADGNHERVIYDWVYDALEKHLPKSTSPHKILVPGSGLGRLAHELANRGYEVDAVEWSPQMRQIYRYLESLETANSVTYYAYVDWWSHQPNTHELMLGVPIPQEPLNSSAVLLIEGDFTKELHDIHERYDGQVTFFFIDTAKNVLDYFEVMSQVLKPGAIWVNIGPLLYYEAQVEFTLEELMNVAEEFGFEFLDTDDSWGPLTLPDKKARSRQIPYMFNERSLRRNTYMAQFWVARKKAASTTQTESS